MSDSANSAAPSSKADIWIAIGVIGCLALGASVTFLLSGHKPADSSATPQPVPKGVPIAASSQPAGATPGTSTAVSTSTIPAKQADGDFMNVTFDTLSSYYYEIPDVVDTTKPAEKADDAGITKRPKDQIPAPVRALNGKKVSIQGFMIPIKLDKGATKNFLIVKDRSVCCFGRVPRMNEWVSVKMNGDKTTKFIGDQPVTIFGTLEVGEEIVSGEVMSIYRLNADDVAGPLDL
jgi:hypothetical protein